MEEVQGQDYAFREEDFFYDEDVPKVDVPEEEVKNSGLGFREEDFIYPEEHVHKEQIPGSGLGFREEDFIYPEDDVNKQDVPKEEVPSQTSNWVPYWVNWIKENMNVFEEIKTQPWFHNLRVEWKEYQKAAEQGELNEGEDTSSPEMRKKDAWKKWVAKQHELMDVNSEQDWFKHLLENVEEVDRNELGKTNESEQQQQKQKQNELKTEEATQSTSSTFTKAPKKEELCKKSYKKNFLIAKLWMLILALVFEECELEKSLHDKELYVDNLLENTLS
ncbi:SICA antigen [Plasmodium coatneyi]|uniref:SICA antigen n=1 Tax=Plasmodium coatneyi TaxID=208452 RepID=A0A1B1E7D4_9APIC|nr:SICA antigen [Plasmodium coatneyi]ANQ10669.1 SICA antigen [Plasmodium coatneyi]